MGIQGRKRSAVRLLFRGLLAICTLAFFVSTFRLSIAPTYPYLKGSPRSGHLSKMDRASEACAEGTGDIAVGGQGPRLPRPLSSCARLVIPAYALPGIGYLRSVRFRSPPAC